MPYSEPSWKIFFFLYNRAVTREQIEPRGTLAGQFLREPSKDSFFGHRFKTSRELLIIRNVRDSGFGIRGSGFGIRDSGFGIRDSGFGVRSSGFGVRGSGFGIRDSEFGVLTFSRSRVLTFSRSHVLAFSRSHVRCSGINE